MLVSNTHDYGQMLQPTQWLGAEEARSKWNLAVRRNACKSSSCFHDRKPIRSGAETDLLVFPRMHHYFLLAPCMAHREGNSMGEPPLFKVGI